MSSLLLGHRLLQLHQVLGLARVGMMDREIAVDHLVEDDVLAADALGEQRHRLARRAVAGVPADLEAAEVDIRSARSPAARHRPRAPTRSSRLPLPLSTSPAAAILPRSWIISPKNGLRPIISLKPLWVGGLCEPVTMIPPSVVQLVDREIEHRRRPDADRTRTFAPAPRRPSISAVRQRRRAQAPVAADRDRAAHASAGAPARSRRRGRSTRHRRSNRVSPTMPRMSYSRRMLGWNVWPDMGVVCCGCKR